jgi:hypothetical protein
MTPEEMYLFHQTPEALAKKLLEFVPLQEGDTVYEPFKGEGAFFKNFPANTTNLWAEIKQGKDFQVEQDYDWVITNPPFRLTEEYQRINGFWLTLDYFTQRARKGVAMLFNKKCLEALTPKRLETLASRGFTVQKIVVCSVKKWHGRYYFLIVEKKPTAGFSFLRETY